MPTYSPPTDFGMIQPIDYSFEDSPLAFRPIYPAEMAATLVQYFQIIFSDPAYLLNQNLAYLTNTDAVTILSNFEQDASEIYPKITVTHLQYQTPDIVPSLQDAGVNASIDGINLSGAATSLLNGACRVTIASTNQYEASHVGTEVYLDLLRDRKMMMNELNVKQLSPQVQGASKTDKVGSTPDPGVSYQNEIVVRWTSIWAPMLWTESTF